MRKIKVMRIIARLNVGGPAKHVIILTEGLRKDRYDSSLVYGSIEQGEGDMSYLIREKALRYFSVPELSRAIRPAKDFAAFLRIYRIIRGEKPDIVHTNTAKAGTLGRIAAVLAGVPVKVHTYHGHIFRGYFS